MTRLHTLLLLLLGAGVATSQLPRLDLTASFLASSTSVCGEGDTPTSYEAPQNSGLLQSCRESEFAAERASDGNSSTRWQSVSGASPVSLSFTLSEPGLALDVSAVQLMVSSGLPRRLHIQRRAVGGGSLATLQVLVANASVDCGGLENCAEYSVEELLPDGGAVLFCPLLTPQSESTVADISLTFEGFQDIFTNTTSQYYAILEVQLLGWVADSYYVRSLTAILVEGEHGYSATLDPQPLTISTDEALIAGFSSRGFATFSFDHLTQKMYSWEFSLLPVTTSYQVWLSYTNPGSEVRLSAMVISGELTYNAAVLFASCPTPDPCHAPLVMPSDITSIAQFLLVSGESATLTLTLTNIDLNLDVIFAVPMAFYEAEGIEDGVRFLDNCDFISGSLGRGTNDELFCLETAVQLSLNFYQLTYLCGCSEVGASGDVCEVYGGECDCINHSDGFSRITGRRCDLCPFTKFLTNSGCADCGCTDTTESCDVATGQCTCPPLVTGRTCDSCMANSYGDPSEGCFPCGCGLVGTDFCNSTTGVCVCKEGVAGMSCGVCESGWFNLTYNGCQECGCDNIGSLSNSCDEAGECLCQPNVGGAKCTECVPGSFFLSPNIGCILCNCSGRSNTCSQNPTVTSEPSEVCSCPAPYEGESCERCQTGWFLSDETRECEVCQCNGLAESCLDGSGVCVGCRGNSTGVGCDVCVDGYYDTDPTDPGLTCLPCPCTTVTALDTLCSADSLGNPVCNCRQGHEGDTCNTCANGYFGSPPEFRCTQCDCNGNINPSVPGSCDMETGRCVLCINNSTGDECEQCASGFHGNATVQNCQPCDCSVEGSEGSVCDSETGQCSCLPGVNGLRCENCLPGYWDFTPSIGCELCACEGSFVSDVCDVVTGECECSEGVGGRACDFCLPGFFDYSLTSGCAACGCGEGAINSSCSSDGQCYCQPGVGGAKCDLCQPFAFNLSSSGCESCGECELQLKESLEREEEILEAVSDQEQLVLRLAEVDQRGLGEVMGVASELRGSVEEVGVRLEGIEAKLGSVEDGLAESQETIFEIEERVSNSTQVTFDLQPTAEEVGNQIQAIYNEVQQGLARLADSAHFADSAQPLVSGWVAVAEGIADNVTELSEHHSGDGYHDDILSLEEEVERANQIADEAVSLRELSLSLNGQAENLIGGLGYLFDDINITSSSLEAVNEELQTVQTSLEESADELSHLIDDVSSINDVIARANSEIESSNEAILSSNLTSLCDAIDDLATWIGTETPAMSGSGVGPLTPELDDGIGLEASGSGMTLAPDSLTGTAALLSETVGEVGVAVDVCGGLVSGATNHSLSLQDQAEAICSLLTESLESGGAAVEAILNYSSSIEAIEEALAVATETREVLEDVGRLVMGGGGAELHSEAQQLLVFSESLVSDAETEAGRVGELVSEFATAEVVAEVARRQSAMTGQSVAELGQRVTQVANLTEITFLVSSEVAHYVETTHDTISTSHSSLVTQLTSLHGNISVAMATVDATATNLALSRSILAITNTTLMTAQSDLESKSSLLEMTEREREANSRELDGLAADLAGLKQDLRDAREAAALIDLALRFHGNSSVGYRGIPELTPSDSATRISMVFNPSETTGLMLHSLTGSDEQSSLTLSLQNGSLAFATEVGGAEGVELVSTATGVIQEDTWYQLFATREREVSQLSVAPLQDGTVFPTTLSTSSHTHLSPPHNDTLYLGGSPVLLAPDYSGCLDRIVINNRHLPLLLPDIIDGHPLQLCGPRPPPEVARQLETGVWLQGAGSYVQVVSPLIEGSSPILLSLEFRTFSSDGLLVSLYSENMDQRLAVVVEDGRLSLQFSRDMLTSATADTVGVVNDGEWHLVEISVDTNTAFLLVDSNENVSATPEMSVAPFSASSDRLYLGGLPSDLQASIASSQVSLPGCVRNLHISGRPLSLNSSLSSSRVSFSGCPAEVISGARFTGEGGAVLRPTTNTVHLISFEFHSMQLASLLLSVGHENASVVISLYHTMICVDAGDGAVVFSTQDGLSDGAWHHVVLELGNDRMNLTVDGEATVTTPVNRPLPEAGSDVIVGGANPPTGMSSTTESFRGCIRQLAINEMPVDFSQALSLDGVSLYGCRPAAPSVITPPPPPPPPPLPPPPSTNPNTTVGLDGLEGSFLAFSLSPAELGTSHIITIQFQTSSPNAMLLYTQGNIDFLALELIRGYLHYTYNLGSGRIILSSNHTYSDGLQHSVSLYRGGQEGTMEIDRGVETVSGLSPGSFTSLNVDIGVLFVGGTPLFLPPTNLIRFRNTGEEIPPSTRGCLFSLSLNSLFLNLSSPEASQGVEDCLMTYSNLATFNGLGYLQLLDEVNGGVDFSASLEFRTSDCTGLLLYTASSAHPDHLALELVDGLMRFIFDNGPSPTAVEYLSPSLLCDGEWHSVSVVKDQITGSLSVDGAEPVTMESDVINYVSLDINDPLLVGGVPDPQALRSSVLSGQVQSSSFDGCIRNVYVSTSRTGPLERDMAQASASSGVTFHSCNP